MFENPRRGRQARNFTTNVSKILDLKSSPEQIFFRKLSLGAPVITFLFPKRDRHGSEQAIGCELPASNCAEIIGSLHVKFCRATSARYNIKWPASSLLDRYLFPDWVQAMVVKARSEKIYCEPFFKGTVSFSRLC